MPPSNKILNVGLIGANPDRGWGTLVHIPALLAMPEYNLVGVATTNIESAQRTAAMFSVPHAFSDPFELIAHPNIDVVSITVKAPHHHVYAMAALEAGKHIYCEWPLGNGLAEAEELAEAARSRYLRTAIGLQGRSAPEVLQLRDMIASGCIGRPIASSIVVSSEHLNDVMHKELETLLYPEHGTTMFTIHLAHYSDVLCSVLGEFRHLSADISTQRTVITIAEDSRKVTNRAPDHIALCGIMENGASSSLHLRGGHSRGINALWEINGTEGDLLITAQHGNLQMAKLQIQYGRRGDLEQQKAELENPMLNVGGAISRMQPVEIDPKYRFINKSIEGPSINVAQTYALLSRDILTGDRACPDFDDALIRHRFLQAVACSAREGHRESYT